MEAKFCHICARELAMRYPGCFDPADPPEYIKAQMRISHGTIRAWEAANGVPIDSVREIFRRRSVSRTAKAIAAFVGWPVEDLFPQGYFIVRNHKSQKRDAHRLNEGAL